MFFYFILLPRPKMEIIKKKKKEPHIEVKFCFDICAFLCCSLPSK